MDASMTNWIGSWVESALSQTHLRELPVAEVIEVEDRLATRIVKVRCPFAARHEYRGRGHQFHTHGWPHGVETPGTRVPHCDHDPGGLYRLELSEKT